MAGERISSTSYSHGLLLCLPALDSEPAKALQQRVLPPSIKAEPQQVKVPALGHSTQPAINLAAKVDDLLCYDSCCMHSRRRTAVAR